MRHIKKTSSPQFFEDWKEKYKNQKGVEPTYDKQFRGSKKLKFKQFLIDEQYGLCCYCMKKLQFEQTHIEHIKPQGVGLYKQEDLNYCNMLASCDGYDCNRENCGHRKNNWYDPDLTVSPLEDNVESLFTYTIDGYIIEADNDIRANTTIIELGLCEYGLRKQREAAIHVSGIFDDDFEDEKENLIAFYKTPRNGQLAPFCQAILYCIENS